MVMVVKYLSMAVSAVATMLAANAATGTPASAADVVVTHSTTVHKDVAIDGIKIHYREAGPSTAPSILLLHGFPSSSRMFDTLIPLLADRYHLIAPDYPGFGHSDAPAPDRFKYTFQNITDVIDKFTQAVGLIRYAMYVSDYGGPIGFRLALAHPERVTAIIVQNAVAHNDGLDDKVWAPRRAFWADRTTYEERVREGFLSPVVTRARHVGTSPRPERYSPDLWDDELAFLNKAGMADIQIDLFHDYRTNVEAYPKWQQYLREHKPPLLVTWGKYDPNFALPEAEAFRRDVPEAEIHIVEGGHFALDEAVDEIATLMRAFLSKKLVR
jgi:pimeloyl-ACP methyl ester carboxylesterase